MTALIVTYFEKCLIKLVLLCDSGLKVNSNFAQTITT